MPPSNEVSRGHRDNILACPALPPRQTVDDKPRPAGYDPHRNMNRSRPARDPGPRTRAHPQNILRRQVHRRRGSSDQPKKRPDHSGTACMTLIPRLTSRLATCHDDSESDSEPRRITGRGGDTPRPRAPGTDANGRRPMPAGARPARRRRERASSGGGQSFNGPAPRSLNLSFCPPLTLAPVRSSHGCAAQSARTRHRTLAHPSPHAVQVSAARRPTSTIVALRRPLPGLGH